MTPLKAGQLGLRAAMLLFLAWLYGGDLLLWSGARSAEVAALSELPRVELAALGVLVALGGLGVLVVSVLQKKPASWRPQRLLSIAVVSLLFFDFVVLSSRKSMLPAEEQAVLAVQAMAEGASELSGEEAVLRDPSALEAMAQELGAVPYFEAGERVPKWKVETREGCPGPAGDARASRAGTFIYCVSGDRKRAWVTLVGTAAGERFGPRVVVSTDDAWVGEVHVKPRDATPPEEAEEPAPPSVWEQPTPDESP